MRRALPDAVPRAGGVSSSRTRGGTDMQRFFFGDEKVEETAAINLRADGHGKGHAPFDPMDDNLRRAAVRRIDIEKLV